MYGEDLDLSVVLTSPPLPEGEGISVGEKPGR